MSFPQNNNDLFKQLFGDSSNQFFSGVNSAYPFGLPPMAVPTLAECEVCQKRVQKQDLKTHVEQCKNEQIKCAKCKLLLIRKELPSHRKVCLEALISCDKCHCELKRCKSEEHSKTCPSVIENCVK